MSLSINNNPLALTTADELTRNYSKLSRTTERLSSGLRINSAADDAAGLAIRELMRADIAALRQGMRNTNDAISMLQTADGALGIIDEKLIRMKELAEQASTGSYNSVQRAMIDSEFQQMASEIDRIARATDFNGVKILDYNGVSSTTGTGSDGNQYVTSVTNADSSTFGDPSQIPIGDSIYKIRSSKYSYFDGVDAGLTLSITNGSNVDPSKTYTIGWNGSHWTVESFQYESNPYSMGAGKYTYDPSNINALIINDAGNTINLSLSVYDSNNNLVTNYAPLTGESTTVNVYNSNSTSFPTFSLSPDSATGSLTATQNGNGVDFTIDMGNGNTFSKSYSNALNLSGAMFVVTNKIKDPDEPAEIPDDVVKIHFGTGNDSSEDYYYINKSDATINGLGLSGVTIDTQEGAQKSLETIDDAIVKKDEIRAYYGTMQNRLENTLTNLSVQAENLQAAETRISDADVATEMMHFVRNQILTQSALAMLSQANNIPQMAMRLIV